MPLTGFLDGFNEQRLTEQRLQDEAQMSQLRAVEAGMKMQEMKKDQMVQQTLAQVFQGVPQAAGAPEREEMLTNNLERAGAMIMPVDPKRGLEMISGASLLKQRKAAAEDKRLEAEASAREAQGSALNSITGPENYQQGVDEFLRRGGKLPSWYTGDWEKDAPKVEQAARASMSAKDQSLVSRRQAGEAADAERLKNETERLALRAARDAAIAEREKDQAEYRRREADRKAVADQENLRRKSIATAQDKETALDALEARSDLPKMDMATKREIAARAAMAARRVARDSDEDMSSLINSELDKILSEDVEKPKAPTLLDPMSWFFTPNATIKQKGAKASKPIRGASEPRAPARGFPTPSAEALQYLRDNPDTRDKFREVYGYAP